MKIDNVWGGSHWPDVTSQPALWSSLISKHQLDINWLKIVVNFRIGFFLSTIRRLYFTFTFPMAIPQVFFRFVVKTKKNDQWLGRHYNMVTSNWQWGDLSYLIIIINRFIHQKVLYFKILKAKKLWRFKELTLKYFGVKCIN